MENLYGYICDKHHTTCLTWVNWLAEDDCTLPCCSECGSIEKMRHMLTTKIDIEKIKQSKSVEEQISKLSDREKNALKEAVDVTYFGDRSDYINGLWAVINTFIDFSLNEDIDISELRDMLEDKDDK